MRSADWAAEPGGFPKVALELSTLTLVRVAVVRRFVEMSWTCRPWAPGVRGCRAVDSGGPPPGPHGRRSVPFNGPRHSRARKVIRVPYCRRTVIPQHGSHYPAGTPPRPTSRQWFYFSLSCPAPSPPARSRHSCRTARRRSVRRRYRWLPARSSPVTTEDRHADLPLADPDRTTRFQHQSIDPDQLARTVITQLP